MKLEFVFAFIFLSSIIYSQTDSTLSIEEYFSQYLDEQIASEDDDIFLNQIESLLKKPVDLNKADLIELNRIPILSNTQVISILNYREKHGRFFSKQEIFSIEGIDKSTARTLFPLIFLSESTIQKRPMKVEATENNFDFHLRSRVMNSDKKYLSAVNNKIYNRFNLRYHNMEFGSTIEKDKGEKNNFDFNSFHLQLNNFLLDKTILGDYFIQFGSGLALWNPYSISKSTVNVTHAVKNRTEIMPYRSTDENKFFRGATITNSFGSIKLSAFYSQNRIDGRYDSLEERFFFKIDGYHLSKNDFLKRDKIKMQTIGSMLEYQPYRNFNLNFLYYRNTFQSFDFPIITENVVSANYNLFYSNIEFQGEVALVRNKIKGIHSITFFIDRNLRTAFSLRHYPLNSSIFFGNGFGENSDQSGELGFYSAVEWLNEFADINFYLDQFKLNDFGNSNFYLNGNELMINIQKYFGRSISLSVKYFFENKEYFESSLNSISNHRTSRTRFEFSFFPTKQISNKCRIEFSNSEKKNIKEICNGFLVYDEIQTRFSKANLSISIRITFFKTDGYDSRIYAFENDLPGLLAVSPFYNDGMKWYFLIKYSPIRSILLSLKYSDVQKTIPYSTDSYNFYENRIQSKLNLQLDIDL